MALSVSSERQTDRILDYFRLLNELGGEMSSSAQIGEILGAALSAIEDVFDLQRALLLAAQDSDGTLLPVAARGLAIETVPAIKVAPRLCQSLMSKPHLPPALHSLLGNLADQLAFRGHSAWPAKDSAIIPLVVGGELVGLFVFEPSSEWPTLNQHNGDLLTSMCQNLAVYLTAKSF